MQTGDAHKKQQCKAPSRGWGVGMVQGRSYSVKQDKRLKLPSRYTTVELDEA
jgi:hypothetical protein